MKRSHIYFLIILGVSFLFALQWQISKLDRKLTCVYNTIILLQFYGPVNPEITESELRDIQNLFVKQRELVEQSCDKKYVFLGIPKSLTK